MELEEMKNLWQKYDKALAENRMLNEKLINELLRTKSGTPLKNLLNAEYLGVVLCIFLLLIFLTMSGRATTSPVTAISFGVLLLEVVYFIVAGFYKIRLLSRIDISEASITDVAYRVQRFRLIISKERLYGCILFPFILVPAYIFMDGSVERMIDNWFILLIATAAGIAIGLVLYRSIYFNNIKQILQSLEDVKSFKQEAA